MTVSKLFSLNPNRTGFSKPCNFGGDRFDLALLRSAGCGPGPFWRAPDADRENTLGYSWPPHLYQGKSKLEEKFGSVNARIGPTDPILCLCVFLRATGFVVRRISSG